MASEEWFRDWFDETYLDIYRHRDLEEARGFVHWLGSRFSREADHGVTDLACGAGRHSWAMALDLGWKVIGVDLSPELLKLADRGIVESGGGSIVRNSVVRPGFIRGDIRRLPLKSGAFGLAVNLFTSFGYFLSEEENLLSLAEMGRVLAPGGVLLLDHVNSDWALANHTPEDSSFHDGKTVRQERWYDEESRRYFKKVTIGFPDGRNRTVQEAVRMYRPEEMFEMCDGAGLEVEQVFGGYDGAHFSRDASRRMIIQARKRS